MERTTDEDLAHAVERMKARRRLLLAFGGVLSVALFLLAGYFLLREVRQERQREAAERLAEEQWQAARSRPERGGPVEIIPTFAEEIRGSLELSRGLAEPNGASPGNGMVPLEGGADEDPGATGAADGPAERPASLPRMLREMDGESPAVANAARRADIQATIDAIQAESKPEDRLPWIRLADQVGRQFLSYHEKDRRGIVINELREVRTIEVDDRQFAVADALTDDGQRLQAVFEQVDGRYLLDWESLTHFDPVSWQAFRHPDGPRAADFRVLATIADIFAGPFADVDYVSLRLEHPRERGILFGYFRRNDPLFSTILEQLERSGESPLPLLLRLSVPDAQARTNQVVIDAVLGDGWIRR